MAYVKIRPARVYGPGDTLMANGPFSFYGRISDSIDDCGKKMRRLHAGSVTLAEEAALLNMHAADMFGGDFLAGRAKDVLRGIFECYGQGNVTDDACDYDSGNSRLLSGTMNPDKYVVAKWTRRPDSIELTDGGKYVIVPGESSVEEDVVLPRNPGFVECTSEGAYHPFFGTPFSTVESYGKAVRSYVRKGFSEEFARYVVSHYTGTGAGRGVAMVVRRCTDGISGRFYVDVVADPEYRSNVIGRLGAKRPGPGKNGNGKCVVVLSAGEHRKLNAKMADKCAELMMHLKER